MPKGNEAVLFQKPKATVKAFIEITKPPTIGLLTFTALAPLALAARETLVSPLVLGQAILALVFSCAGANAVSCYLDRDLDALMERTKRRALPTGRIYPPEKALYFGLVLLCLGLLLGWELNLLSFLVLVLGAADYLLVYSLWSKRRTKLNIVLGGFSGGFPVLFGWVAAGGEITFLPFLLAALVVLWIPSHIWSLAIFYRQDYVRARVPMLPAVSSPEAVKKCILATAFLFALFAFFIIFYGQLIRIYPFFALAAAALSVTSAVSLYLNPQPQNAWRSFKVSSPVLFLAFLGVVLEVLA